MQLQQRYDEIKALKGEVVAISFEPMGRLRKEVEDLRLPFPVLSDPSLASYRSYGLARGSLFAVYNPKAVWEFLRLLLKGRGVGGPHGDLRQLGGDFVIDGEGILRFVHPSTQSQERPRMDQLLQVLRSL